MFQGLKIFICVCLTLLECISEMELGDRTVLAGVAVAIASKLLPHAANLLWPLSPESTDAAVITLECEFASVICYNS